MNSQYNEILNTKALELKNPNCVLPEEVQNEMAERRKKCQDTFIENLNSYQKPKYNETEQQLREQLLSEFIRTPGLGEKLERINFERKRQMVSFPNFDRLSHLPIPKFEPIDLAPIAGELELWWSQTTVFLPSKPGMIAFFQPDGLHLAGRIGHNDGDLWGGSLRVLVQFFLGPDRIPNGNLPLFISSPVSDFYGAVEGTTNGSVWPFEGDQWSKCWLNTTQTVWGGLPGIPISIPLVSRSENQNLIFIESHFTNAWKPLPGFLPLPVVQFFIFDRSKGVQVDIEFRLDFQLEGDSDVHIFGHFDLGNAALLRTFQWRLQAK